MITIDCTPHQAAPMLSEALQARRATLGNRHPDTLVSMNSLGRLLHIMGKLDEAGALLREALRARRATLGDEHRDTLDSITNLGMLLKDQVSSVDCHDYKSGDAAEGPGELR